MSARAHHFLGRVLPVCRHVDRRSHLRFPIFLDLHRGSHIHRSTIGIYSIKVEWWIFGNLKITLSKARSGRQLGCTLYMKTSSVSKATFWRTAHVVAQSIPAKPFVALRWLASVWPCIPGHIYFLELTIWPWEKN